MTLPPPTLLTDVRWPASRLLASMDLAAARETDRLCLADGLGMTVEILATDLRATITSLTSDLQRTRDALRTISMQKVGDEIGDEEARDNCDYEFAYERIVGVARKALTTPTGT